MSKEANIRASSVKCETLKAAKINSDGYGKVSGQSASAVSGVISATASSGRQLWQRVGDVVSVQGAITVTASGTGSGTVEIALPVASDFTATTDAEGVAISTAGANHVSGLVSGSIANNTLVLTLDANTGFSDTIGYSAMYLIK